jgi:hypothetical protein
MSMMPIRTRRKASTRSLQLKQAILAVFTQTKSASGRLKEFSEADWTAALWWLDISGMALYLLDEIRRQNLSQDIPRAVITELELRLERNRERTMGLLRDALFLGRCFEAAGVPYALLKGISLVPDSVPDAGLRSQTDLDLLVARGGLRNARQTVIRLGYSLHGNSGSTLEFREGRTGKPDMAKMYSVHSQRALELHVDDEHSELLARRRIREFAGEQLATLSPPDILVQQALHLLKHLCGEYTRLAWVLEFRRHVEARRGDAAFWSAAEQIAAETRNGDVAMGIALWLAEANFGLRNVDIPKQWKIDRLPERVLLWLNLYAGELLLGDSVGSKLYALLRKEIPSRPGENKSTRSTLIPSRLPFPITRPSPQERPRERAARYLIEMRHFVARLRFHVVEDVRFAIEASRWRREVAKCER